MACYSEPTLSEVLNDPLIMTVMRADRVDVSALEKSLREVSGKLQRNQPTRFGGLKSLIAWS